METEGTIRPVNPRLIVSLLSIHSYPFEHPRLDETTSSITWYIYIQEHHDDPIIVWMCENTCLSLSLSMCVLFKHWKCSVAITRTMFPWATLRLKIDFERVWCDKMGVELIKILAIEQEKVEDGYRRYFDIMLKFDLGFGKKRIFL